MTLNWFINTVADIVFLINDCLGSSGMDNILYNIVLWGNMTWGQPANKWLVCELSYGNTHAEFYFVSVAQTQAHSYIIDFTDISART